MKNNNWLKDNGYSYEEEKKVFAFQLQDILDNTRWYLDNSQYLTEYRVRWYRYVKRKKKKDL